MTDVTHVNVTSVNITWTTRTGSESRCKLLVFTVFRSKFNYLSAIRLSRNVKQANHSQILIYMIYVRYMSVNGTLVMSNERAVDGLWTFASGVVAQPVQGRPLRMHVNEVNLDYQGNSRESIVDGFPGNWTQSSKARALFVDGHNRQVTNMGFSGQTVHSGDKWST